MAESIIYLLMRPTGDWGVEGRGQGCGTQRKGSDSVPRVAVAATPGIVVLMKCKQTSKECWL